MRQRKAPLIAGLHARNPYSMRVSCGAAGRIRTVDLRITNALLYRLSYCGVPSGDRCRRKVASEQAALRACTQLLTSAPKEATHQGLLQSGLAPMKSTNATYDFWTCGHVTGLMHKQLSFKNVSKPGRIAAPGFVLVRRGEALRQPCEQRSFGQ
jgi:hypothetical protein